MAITVVDVIGRYVLNAPLPGAFETTQLVLAALVFTALPLVGRTGGHVEVDLVAGLMAARVARAFGLLAAVVSVGVLTFFAYRLLLLAAQQWEDGTRSVSLAIPYAPVALLGAGSVLLAALYGWRHAWRTGGDLRGAVESDGGDPSGSGAPGPRGAR